MEEAKQELHRIINDREMKDSLLLVFANKQDLDNCAFPHFYVALVTTPTPPFFFPTSR